MPNLAGKICLVTGASRGIGRGVAIQLITYGATCYITGRDLSKLQLVEKEAKSRGATGRCIPYRCDHSIDEEVKKLFEEISREQNGQLDLLVNNAYAAVTYLFNNVQVPFWDQPAEESWDLINNVGLRNHYICAVHAARLMVPQRKGLIVNISSAGGRSYFLMPQYGIGKTGKDRMARDCAWDLEKYNVAFISLWPNPVKTETIMERWEERESVDHQTKKLLSLFETYGESTELAGKCIAHLLADAQVMQKSGQIMFTADLANEYGFKDIDGQEVFSFRSFKGLLSLTPLAAIARLFPSWLKLPKFLFFAMLERKRPAPKNPSKYE